MSFCVLVPIMVIRAFFIPKSKFGKSTTKFPRILH